MAGKLRQIMAQYHLFPKIVNLLGNETDSPQISYQLIKGAVYGIMSFYKTTPIIVKIDDIPDITVTDPYPTSETLRKYVLATDLESGGKITFNYDGIDDGTAGTYNIVATITDQWGSTATVNLPITLTDSVKPVLTLVGSADVTLEWGTVYTEQGATVSDNSDDVISVVVGGDTVDPNTLGEYVITYNATDGSSQDADEITRTVTVVNTGIPVITVTAGTDTIEAGATWTDAGATAVDAMGNDISANVTVDASLLDNTTVGDYVITYRCTDDQGNVAVLKERTVTVEDTTVPVITLVGNATDTYEVDQEATPYVELGATVSDNTSEVIEVVIAGDAVDLTTVGEYVVTYNASDSSGNAAVQVTRTITVEDTTVPVIALEPGVDTATIHFSDDGASAQVLQNESWVDPGVVITDNSGESLAATVGGDTVDTTTLGAYVITYDVDDSSGNSAVQVERTVNVVTVFVD